MSSLQQNPCAPLWAWWIRHNPTYLLSAACMALTARLLLVSPHNRAGQLATMLVTLAALQLYEWTVGVILMLLHRSRRAPEDEPSLLLVAALFWTGPLVATAEMTAHDLRFGLGFGIAAAIICLGEMLSVRRTIHLPLSRSALALGVGCITLLGAAPPLLKIPDGANQASEFTLYAAWWLLAVIVLVALPIARRGGARFDSSSTPEANRACSVDFRFIAIVLASTVAQLIAMNYAFLTHAASFYASPLLIAIGLVGIIATARARQHHPAVWLFAALPLVAIGLTLDRFHPSFPRQALPRFLRDPAIATLLLAAIVWWIGYHRARVGILLHIANTACAAGLWRLAHLPGSTVTIGGEFRPDRALDLLTLALYTAALYLAAIAWLRRSRVEALVAIFLHQVALTLLVRDMGELGWFIILACGGWHWLIALHILSWWPRCRATLVPVCFLVIVSWSYEFSDVSNPARINAALIVIAAFAAGWRWPWTRYRSVSAGTAAAHGAFYSARLLAEITAPVQATCILLSFVLLAIGAAVSWHKSRLTPVLQMEKAPPGPPQEPAPPEDPSGMTS